MGVSRLAGVISIIEEGYKVGQKPVTVEVIASILTKDIDDLEPRLTRNGFDSRIAAAPQ